ncbi:UbiG, 3-demethylubiquinone-9 3-O-methyltransferase [uncultured Caudovirales phage]|nr:UbiG, 3-demethylubiquinone-9 3-O-methyltransferase [uncultured Caudovirales phage]
MGYQIQDSPRHALFTLSRYKFASRLLPQNKKVSVLDLGCSEGYGSLMLAEIGHSVVGIDTDLDAIAHAQRTINKPNIRFTGGPIDHPPFNAVVSLDVIEHISAEDTGAFMDGILLNLTDDGICIIGTPNDTANQYSSETSKIGHINMFTAERLSKLMGEYFTNVFMFGMNDEVVHTGFYPMCHYLVALGCGPRK